MFTFINDFAPLFFFFSVKSIFHHFTTANCRICFQSHKEWDTRRISNKPRGTKSSWTWSDYLGNSKIFIFFCHNWISLSVTSEKLPRRSL